VNRAGIDAGTENIKSAILSEGGELGWAVVAVGTETTDSTAQKALAQAAQKLHLSVNDIDYITATGTDAENVIVAHRRLSEVLCLAKGMDFLMPSTRTLIDIGALKTLGVRCSGGNLLRFVTSSKCAVGTGAFLEAAANVLGISASEMDELAAKAKKDVEIESTCAVFAESEIISLVHGGTEPEYIARGVFKGLAKRVYSLLLELGIERDVALVGGLARSKAMVGALEEAIGFKILVPDMAEIVSALGAALFKVKVQS
jgi:predicted CoA-substrate-specific enzyme activase